MIMALCVFNLCRDIPEFVWENVKNCEIARQLHQSCCNEGKSARDVGLVPEPALLFIPPA